MSVCSALWDTEAGSRVPIMHSGVYSERTSRSAQTVCRGSSSSSVKTTVRQDECVCVSVCVCVCDQHTRRVECGVCGVCV